MLDHQAAMESLEELAEKTPKALTNAVRVIDELYEQTVRDENELTQQRKEIHRLKDQLSIAMGALMAVPFAWKKSDIRKSARNALRDIGNIEDRKRG